MVSATFKTFRNTTCLAALVALVASPALADVTAAELWQEWQDRGPLVGQTRSADEVIETEDGLILRGFTATGSVEGAVSVARLEEIALIETGDGTVRIVPSDTYEITSTSNLSDAPSIEITITVSHDGLDAVASGTPEERAYDISADAVNVRQSIDDGSGVLGDGILVDISVNDIDQRYVFGETGEEGLNFSSAGDIGSINMSFDVAPPDDDVSVKFAMSVSNVTSTSGGETGNLMRIASEPGLGPEGFDLTLDTSYDAIIYEMTVSDPANPLNIFYRNAGGAFGGSFSEEGMTFSVSATDSLTRVSGPAIPAPVEFTVGSMSAQFAVPLAPGDGPVDASARIAYDTVQPGAALLDLFDPGQGIPRDPISAIIDLEATVDLFVNLLAIDPTTLDTPPGNLRSLDINEVSINAAGASLRADGNLTFAEGQIVPLPVGTVEIEGSGLNALIDTLTQAGLLPVEQGAMARGLMGAFARPGPTADTLESTIQFNEGGGITANGVPLR